MGSFSRSQARRARRNPIDPPRPLIGEELAVRQGRVGGIGENTSISPEVAEAGSWSASAIEPGGHGAEHPTVWEAGRTGQFDAIDTGQVSRCRLPS
jgi:hypothetical protein